MKKLSKRVFGLFLALVLVLSMVPFGVLSATATGAAAQNTYTTGSIINYGSYPQTRVTDSGLIAALNAQTLGANSTVSYNGERYKRVYFTTTTNSYQATNGYAINTVYWFKYEPIQWRVLSNVGGELFVMAEKILGARPYNQVNTSVTWETCTLRSWLNNEFYGEAFNATEQAKIKTSTVINENNPWNGTNGGNNTNDKLFLLSYSEVTNPAYGFSSSYSNYDTARRAQGSDFAKSNGLLVSTDSSYLGNSHWWLRSPGIYQYFACFVFYKGFVSRTDVRPTYIGVRPALKLHLTPLIFESSEDSTCVVDYANNMIFGLPAGSTGFDAHFNVAEGFELAYTPTHAGWGTGTVVEVKKNGIVVERFTVVIFGDVNGDGLVDANDAGIITDYENWLVTWDPVTDAAFLMAADINGDGNADATDADLLTEVENWNLFLDQYQGRVYEFEPIDGTVAISGNPVFGGILSADTSGVLPQGATLEYLWRRGAITVGTGRTYTVTQEDIGRQLTVTVTGYGRYYGGMRSSAVIHGKAVALPPAPPTVLSKTAFSVTLNAQAGYEYRINDGDWQTSGEFTGLDPNTEYLFYARTIETATHLMSPPSTPSSVKTERISISGVVVITGTPAVGEILTTDCSGVFPAGATVTYQWYSDGYLVSGETGNQYTVMEIDEGAKITVQVTGIGDYQGTLTSAQVTVN